MNRILRSIEIIFFLFFFFFTFFPLATSAENSQQTPHSEKDIIPFTPPSSLPSGKVAKEDKGGFSESKTLKPAEFVFDIKDGKLWLEAKDADLNEVLKAIGKKAGIEVEIDKEIKEKVTIKIDGISLEEGIQKIAKNWAMVFNKDEKDNFASFLVKNGM